ncbi:ras guanine nucleotide exchange factor domain-containing protein [Mucor mucedo]|uniref:ras guanine nucleotide exchange factor domain-containing protein n=1 Tax=Mucor mucedo TaxID=29922 RepID=UPI002220224E|nr:ras guanine nucleotide exchange factor domain-containing protein [Mucor mucedo]KAI7893884.1 ras guanine nucleotide exchange factor domain-containing protein [Mucor mucedo]
MTPKGRYYYYNMATEETTWELENIDPDTGILISSLPDSFPTSPKQYTSIDEMSMNDQSSSVYSDDKVAISWQSLSTSIGHAVHNLRESIRQGQNAYFGEDTTTIVHRIRLLLYVSNCLDKETSVHLKANKQLRTQHRTLLASLAKLVLATKVASNALASPEALSKLQSDSEDVMVSLRHFLTCAQQASIEIKDTKPSLTCDQNLWRHSPFVIKNSSGISMLGKADMVNATLVLVNNVRSAMNAFMDSVRDAFSNFENQDIQGTLVKLKANAPMLVAQFRNLSNTTSILLNSIEEVCQLNQGNAKALILIKSKQPIYAAMGSLFVVSQTITSVDQDAAQMELAYHRLVQCIEVIESSISHVLDATHKQTDDRVEPNNSSTGSIGDDEDKSEEFTTRPPDIGLNTLLSSSSLAESETSSLHSLNNVRQVKEGKIAKFFGEDTMEAARRRDTVTATPTSTVLNASMSNAGMSSIHGDIPWFLASDVGANDMVLNMEGNVKGGSLHALVQRLTQHDQLDSKFNSTFLLTYRSFCTTEELFDELFQRYQLVPPEELTSEELEIWREKKLKLVRLRVFNVIKSWLETYFNEEEDRPILPEISQFTDHVIVESMKFGAEQLSKLIKKRMQSEDSGQIRKMKLNVRTADMPAPILPKNMKRIKFLELDPHELARQMTVMDFRLYNRIKPVECLDKNWGKPDTEVGHIAANVKASIEHSNQVTAWVTDSILSKDEIKKRAVVMKHWIFVAERCRLLNNYNTCMAILSAFDNGSIGRLKRTWELISARSMQILQNIRKLMGANRNFSEYREIIHNVNPPCIPFLGIYLQDLTFIEDGNSNYLKKTNSLINFAKRMKTAEVIRDLQQYQSTHYMLTAVPDIQEFIKTHLHSSREEEELYNLSLKLEPRERGEDTIARRLKESGL